LKTARKFWPDLEVDDPVYESILWDLPGLKAKRRAGWRRRRHHGKSA